MNEPILAIDIGNSRVKTGLVDTDSLTRTRRTAFASAGGLKRIADLVGSHAKQGIPAVLCSVNTALKKELSAVFARKGFDYSWVAWSPKLPFNTAYAEPGRLGADRIASLLYCRYRHPGKTVAVVSAGTAVTIDLLVDGKRHAGGIIMPGHALQLRSLHEGTADLPELAADGGPVRLPGRSTRECMRAGVLYGTAGAIDTMICRMLRGARRPAADVVATGGGWKRIGALVATPHEYVADLVLLGTALFHRNIAAGR